MNSYLTVRKILGHPNNFKSLNGWNQLMEKKYMILSTEEWRKTPSPPKQAPIVGSKNCNMRKKPQAQNKGKGKEQATNPYSKGYIIPNIQPGAMENVFQIARTMMELLKKEEARLKYQE
ncbi:hypothetical protein O181_058602 [Austropuccinia psidii MF-1]|uniref:Uncharacterized protein n=1 Tax=Austropuccinia psidii MF-1 TaxID=1389203 RepID=A0A9Q3EF03_9BASI|nr:hypothetical protein [Austropuccinia psidii MF-1]